MIRNGSVGLAGYAASELLESQPDLKATLASLASTTWQGVLRNCVEELAAALAAGRPQFFAGYVGGMRSVLTARGLPSAALPFAVTCLATVLAAELPAKQAALAVGVCHAGPLSASPAAQQEVGRMWQADEINVAEEHFATSTTKTILAQLRLRAPMQQRNGKTLLAVP